MMICNRHKHKLHRGLAFLVGMILAAGCSGDQERINGLHVEYRQTPLGIDVEQPRFGWQMQAPEGKRGYEQTAYRILVTDPSGEVVWDSERVNEGNALAIEYAGSPLKPCTRYSWTVTVWDQDGQEYPASSWFETGLMNPDQSAWSGAQWIGGGDEDLVFFSPYLSVFRLRYGVRIAEGSTRASFVYGANDLRLMDRNKNIWQLENASDESYIKLELDISGLYGSPGGRARLNIYRAGYAKEDRPDVPFKSFDILLPVIHRNNMHDLHLFEIQSAFGRITVTVDGESEFFAKEGTEEPRDLMAAFTGPDRGASVNLNPAGSGGDYLPFGMVCDLGFAMEPGQKAAFSGVEVCNDREPNNILFAEDLNGEYEGIFAGKVAVENGAYVADGGSEGLFVVSDPSHNSTPMLRTEFAAAGKVRSARLYVTARGIYELFLNGERVGSDHYNPGLTQYNTSHMYQTYDVTDRIRQGSNAMGALMSEGWWSGLLSYGADWNHFGDRQSLLARLVISYRDGSEEILATNDKDWKYYGNGPIRYSSLDMGEVYDARKEAGIEGWAQLGFDDSEWKQASVIPLEGTSYSGEERGFGGTPTRFDFDDMKLTGQIGNSAGVFTTLTARSVEEVRPGVYVYDMGQNFVGVPRITLDQGNAGDTMILRYCEMRYPSLEESGKNAGMIMTENYRAALCQDLYIMKDGPQVFQPEFTSRGYQYIEITGIDAPLSPENVEGIAISSVRELTASYLSSNEKVNRLWSNLVWSNIDNFLTLPTDCPQRNERMGWSGDISVFSRTATYVSNSDQFLRRHMLAMRDVQRPEGKFTDIAPIGGGFGGILWGSAGLTVPWEVYRQYRDVHLLEEHYDAMVAYIDYLEGTVDEKTGITSDAQLGDWLGPQNNRLGAPFLAAAYHVYDLWIIHQVAELLGREEDAARFEEMYRERKDFINRTFINGEGKTLGLTGGFDFGRRTVIPWEFNPADTQTSYAVGLALGAFDDSIVTRMAANLAAAVERQNPDDDGILRPEYSLMTGFIGTAWISKSLSDHGYNAHAYKLLQNEQYPSWLYPIKQGATTIWERLNGYTMENGFGGNNSMNSFNHYSFGAVGQWLIAYSLGIQRDEPGFRRFILQPTPDPTGEMTWAEGHYDSMYGRISSRWERVDGGLVYEATVPANTGATLYLPAASGEEVTEGGLPAAESEGVEFMGYENGKAVCRLQPGSYRFKTPL
jgi:alpha-L-rhamnosidase